MLTSPLSASVKDLKTTYELLDRLQKEEKELRAKLSGEDKPLKPEDVALLLDVVMAIEKLKETRSLQIKALG